MTDGQFLLGNPIHEQRRKRPLGGNYGDARGKYRHRNVHAVVHVASQRLGGGHFMDRDVRRENEEGRRNALRRAG